MAEYRFHQIWTSSGKSTIRIKKGGLASPAFWAAVEAAEAEGLSYCGHCHLALGSEEMFRTYQCADCYEARLIGYSNYRPPRRRQRMDAIRGDERGGGHGVPTAVDHRALWGQYAREDAARAAREEQRAEALRLLAEFKAELGTVGTTNSPENAYPVRTTTTVEVDPYSMYDEETQARLNALRNQLNGDI